MAVLPSYSPNDTLGDGGNSLRLLRKEADAGVAMSHFGEQIGNTAVTVAKADAAMDALDAADAKKSAGVADALTRDDMETSWAQKRADLQANIDPSGAGYRKQVEAAVDAHVDEYAEKFSSQRAGENAVLTANFRKHEIIHAIGVEAATRLKSQQDAGKKIIDDAGTIVEANPATFNSVLADGKLRADVLGFDGKVRAPFDAELRRAAEIGRASGILRDNPGAVLDAAKGAVAGFAKADTPPEQAKVIDAAKVTGVDPSLLLAMGHIESGFNPSAKSGSGAAGVFQVLGNNSAYGPHDTKDAYAQGVAVGNFLANRQQDMRDKGVDPTPGRTFMFHNVGEGVAWKLIGEKDPDKTMGQLLYEQYGDSKAKGGGLLRDVIGKANPGFYTPDMTVGEVRTNYENKVNAAMAATDKYVNKDAVTPDEVAKSALTKLTGVPIEQLGAADLAKLADAATKSMGKQTKADAKMQLGLSIFNGDVRMQPFNKEHKDAVDEIVKTQFPQVADDLVASGPTDGDRRSAAYATASKFAAEHSYLPHQWRDAMREAVMTGDPKSPAKAEAYARLSDIHKNNPTAYDASGFAKDVTDRLDMFERSVEQTGNPAQALGFISQEFSQERKEAKQALKATVDNPSTTHPGEVQRLKFADITDMFKKDNGLWRAPIEPENTAQEELLMNAYKQNYKERRLTDPNISPEATKLLALSDVKRSWGISVAFVPPTSAAKFMQNPPDRFYGQPLLGMKPFEDQAREVVSQDLARRFPSDVGTLTRKQASDAILHRHTDPGAVSKYDALKVEVQILPSTAVGTKTNDEVRAGNSSPHYTVAYRDPRSGFITVADEKWQPNKDRMQAEEAVAAKTEKAAAEKKRSAVDSATTGLIAGAGL